MKNYHKFAEYKVINEPIIPRETFYHKLSRWSPDGLAFLNLSSDGYIRIFNITNYLYDYDLKNQQDVLNPYLELHTGNNYNCIWYPFCDFNYPETCMFINVTKDRPIQLREAYYGGLKTSFKIIDHVDRLISPSSINFNLDGAKLYCGYYSSITLIDLNLGEQLLLNTKSKGQQGIISSISFNPDFSGLFACGSYSCSVGLYDEKSNGLLYKIPNFNHGVTQADFTNNGNYLVVAERHSNNISLFDIRNTGQVLTIFKRISNTNQRIEFQIKDDKIMTGQENGDFLVYDINESIRTGILYPEPITSINLHRDCISSATLNPINNQILLTCSGSRKEDYKVVDSSICLWNIQI